MGYDTMIFCPECDSNLRENPYISAFPIEECGCGRTKKKFMCLDESCKFQRRLCLHCDLKKFQRRGRKQSAPDLTNAIQNDNPFLTLILVSIPILIVASMGYLFWKGLGDETLIEKLRKDFPSQRNETWYHFLSVLEKEIPSVKSITFLYDGDKRTPDCLTNKLVSLYSGNKSIEREDITFYASGHEDRDYGFALEHYRSIVEKFRVFVTDLTTVSGSIARIFHSLCDEFSSDIKPSLFIFTLKYDKRTEKLKPLRRAETILKEAWSDLPENEIFPLLSRVIKNVVDVVPEEVASC